MKLLPCPQLGPRPVDEFVYGGAVRAAPDESACTDAEWADYVFHRRGEAHRRREWWYHRPSGAWFVLERDTASDAVTGFDAAASPAGSEPR